MARNRPLDRVHTSRGMWKDGGWFSRECFLLFSNAPFLSNLEVRVRTFSLSLSRTHTRMHVHTRSFYLSVPLELYLSGWMLEFFVLFNKAASLSLCESFFFFSFSFSLFFFLFLSLSLSSPLSRLSTTGLFDRGFREAF